MSWLFVVTQRGPDTGKRIPFCHEAPLHTISMPGFYLAVGGDADTSFCERDLNRNSGWAVVGIGISSSDSGASILTQADWARLMTTDAFDASSLDGHFVALRWKDSTIECFTDQLGLRTAYFSDYENGICISTRLDWLARTTGHAELDFAALGSRWLMLNQVSYDSCIVGIERLGPGGYAIFQRGSVVRSYTRPWSPSFEPQTPSAALGILRSFVQCALDHRGIPSLGLSGGLDSRVLLAFFAGLSKNGFVTHTFGPPEDSDMRIANQITTALGIPHEEFNDPLPDVATAIDGIRSFAAQTFLVEPITTYLKLRYYPKLHERGRLLIDGGFGEIARRQFLGRLVKLGRSAVQRRDASRLFDLMKLPRANIFAPEITSLLELGARANLENTLNSMPPAESISVEDFADLLSVRMRVPNYGGPEQARDDSEILNFMPLVQPSFLRSVFGIPAKERANARLYYEAIRVMYPALGRFPLVKGRVTYRFGLSSNLARLTTIVKSRITPQYPNPQPDQFLSDIREYALDIAHSKEVTESGMYDSRMVVDAVTRYYRGERQLRIIVDWWLTFYLWRESFVAG